MAALSRYRRPDSPAERLYEKLGWQRLGVMPRHAMWPQGGFCDTTFFWKDLSGSKCYDATA